MLWALDDVVDPFQVRCAAGRLALSIDPHSARVRVAAARADRGVAFASLPDGVSTVTLTTCHEDAIAVRDRISGLTATKRPGDLRTRRQRAADAMVEHITGTIPFIAHGVSALPEAHGNGSGEAGESEHSTTSTGSTTPARTRRQRRIEIDVLVPLPTVLGLSDGPGSIDGTAIPADVVRALLTDEATVLRRLVTDPLTGHLLDRHPTTYRPDQGLREFTKTRDQECLIPGCHVRARLCHEDHGVAFPQGPTVRSVLGDLCEHHHLLKHSQGWTIHHDPDGTTRITLDDRTTWVVPPVRLDHTGEPYLDRVLDRDTDDPDGPIAPGFNPLSEPFF
jgi:hypothetical protein